MEKCKILFIFLSLNFLSLIFFITFQFNYLPQTTRRHKEFGTLKYYHHLRHITLCVRHIFVHLFMSPFMSSIYHHKQKNTNKVNCSTPKTPHNISILKNDFHTQHCRNCINLIEPKNNNHLFRLILLTSTVMCAVTITQPQLYVFTLTHALTTWVLIFKKKKKKK